MLRFFRPMITQIHTNPNLNLTSRQVQGSRFLHNKNLPPVHFCGYSEELKVEKGGKIVTCCPETSFFRNIKSSKFMKSYLQENFPNGTHIAEFAASAGQKPYSNLILLDDINQDGKYRITGYDLSQNLADIAENGTYKLENIGYEPVLFKSAKTADEAAVRDSFYRFFRKVDSCYNRPNGIQYVKLIPESTRGLIDFQVGDIEKVDQILEKGKSGVIIFQNALYHILNRTNSSALQHISRPEDSTPDLASVERLFAKTHDTLPNKGIFMLGNLPYDHIYTGKEPTSFTYQNNERIEIFESSPVHQILRDTGFEPVFYERVAPLVSNKSTHNSPVFLPSVWKEITHKK